MTTPTSPATTRNRLRRALPSLALAWTLSWLLMPPAFGETRQEISGETAGSVIRGRVRTWTPDRLTLEVEFVLTEETDIPEDLPEGRAVRVGFRDESVGYVATKVEKTEALREGTAGTAPDSTGIGWISGDVVRAGFDCLSVRVRFILTKDTIQPAGVIRPHSATVGYRDVDGLYFATTIEPKPAVVPGETAGAREDEPLTRLPCP